MSFGGDRSSGGPSAQATAATWRVTLHSICATWATVIHPPFQAREVFAESATAHTALRDYAATTLHFTNTQQHLCNVLSTTLTNSPLIANSFGVSCAAKFVNASPVSLSANIDEVLFSGCCKVWTVTSCRSISLQVLTDYIIVIYLCWVKDQQY